MGLEKALRVPHCPLFLYKLQSWSYTQGSWVTNSYSPVPVLRISHCWHRTISCTAPILFFVKAISLFNMQGPKVNNSRRTIRGPNKVDMRVVNQGEELNQDSNWHRLFLSLLCLSIPSLTLSIESLTTPGMVFSMCFLMFHMPR